MKHILLSQSKTAERRIDAAREKAEFLMSICDKNVAAADRAIEGNEQIAQRIEEGFNKADELNDADQKNLMELMKKLDYNVDGEEQTIRAKSFEDGMTVLDTTLAASSSSSHKTPERPRHAAKASSSKSAHKNQANKHPSMVTDPEYDTKPAAALKSPPAVANHMVGGRPSTSFSACMGHTGIRWTKSRSRLVLPCTTVPMVLLEII